MADLLGVAGLRWWQLYWAGTSGRQCVAV